MGSSERIELYRDKSNRWRWRVVAANNEKTAQATQGYVNFSDALETADKVTGRRLPYDTVDK